MRFSGKFIKHNRMLDVCFEVKKALDLPHKVVLKGEWVNLGFTETYSLSVTQTINIPRDQLSDWSFCTEPTAKCLRYAPWSICN